MCTIVLTAGEKDPISTPVPAQRKTLSRSVLAEGNPALLHGDWCCCHGLVDVLSW